MNNIIWIVYDKPRFEINMQFAELLINRFAMHGQAARVVFEDEILRTQQADLPHKVIMRCDNLSVSIYLESCNVRVYNSSEMSLIANDKWLTHCSMIKLGVMTMPTVLADLGSVLTYPQVIKSRRGHGGTEVFLVRDTAEFENAYRKIGQEKVIAQNVASELGRDLRCYIVGNKLVCAMMRQSDGDFRSNYSLGGRASLYDMSDDQLSMLDSILNSGVTIDFGGIDFIFHNGQMVLNEIEDVVGCRMVYGNTNIDIGGLYVDYILRDGSCLVQ